MSELIRNIYQTIYNKEKSEAINKKEKERYVSRTIKIKRKKWCNNG